MSRTVALAGGVGAARLLRGLVDVVPADELTIVAPGFNKYGDHDQESKYYGKDGRMKNITFLHIFFGLLVLGLLQLYALNV